MNYQRWVATSLAETLLSGPRDVASQRQRLTKVLGEEPEWLSPLVALGRSPDFVKGEDSETLKRQLTEAILDCEDFLLAFVEEDTTPRIRHIKCQTLPPTFPSNCPVEVCNLPKLATEGDLLAWLHLSHHDLLWLINEYREEFGQDSRLQHYHYRWLEKPRGGARLLESPKPLLKSLQRRIHREILSPLPLHSGVQGYRQGHSCLTHARLHQGQSLLLKFDLKDFFLSIGYQQVYRIFRRLGYNHRVTQILSRLSTNKTPRAKLRPPPGIMTERDIQLFRRPHLPQGAPTSPILSNLAAAMLDNRLSGLAKKMGYRYSRYADDFVLSGPGMSQHAAEKLQHLVGAIAEEEGFSLNTRKSAVVGQGQRQQVAGIVVNEKTNLSRKQFDSLKAMLNNCARHGPISQNHQQLPNFQAHLKGKIAYLRSLNPQKGDKLMTLYQKIQWPDQ
ncbi:reverse transcriptase family protein [Hahella ganghwensis]|uniref:reverse transcriptase family protein n=1 Tax=Hahella ganghwensis TaxID=286420 RepID=UPI0003771644|nr:reverse transcriptase family protein [Hahella ganghwensis]